MRRFLSGFLVILLLIPCLAFGEGVDPVDMNVPAYCLLLPGHPEPLLERQGEKELPAAGLRKLPALVTLCRAFDNGVIAESASMQVSSRAAKITGPTAFLESGEQIAAGELLKAAVMISAGDAIVALGENAFGSESVFLNNIQVTLRELGIDKELNDCLGTGTGFSPRELCALAVAAMDSPHFCAWCGQYMDRIIHTGGRETELVNANRLIRSYNGCFGLLTGSQKEEGYCGIFAVRRGEACYVASIMGAKTSEDRFSAAATLFDYAFAAYAPVRLSKEGEILAADWPVIYGDRETVDLVAHEDVSLLLNKDQGKVERRLELPEVLTAPLFAEEKVGSAVFVLGGEEVRSIPLYPAVDVVSNTFRDIFCRIAWRYLRKNQ
ncbi:MAG: D-alanyl-D-alanine carboxypeptidase [Clostridia bacterium]|nr:D-alanyl-D-alanine carboxypeptidase [Clostridia bacterium]